MRDTFFEYCRGCRYEVDVPDNFFIKEGEVENGLVIEDNDGNQYLRTPSGYTSDGLYVRGFWVSRYEISVGNDGNPQSIADRFPVTGINFYDSEKLAEKVGGFLISKEEYNRICMWLVETKAATFEEIFVKGNCDRGNYSNPFSVAKTGSNPMWMINRLDNFLGNCYIWTTERSEIYDYFRIARGGNGSETGEYFPASTRMWSRPENVCANITLRIVFRELYDLVKIKGHISFLINLICSFSITETKQKKTTTYIELNINS